MTVRRSRSLLPHFLAALYGLAIFYASLQPFSPWIAPAPGTPFFLFARWPPRWVRYDVLTNVLAYVPFGFLVALAQGRQRPLGKFTIAIIVGALMSFSMETLQMFEPTRDASVADVLSNTAGAACGGVLALALTRSRDVQSGIASLRDRWFLPGIVGDFGLALMAIWLAVQVNPAIPLFAALYDRPPPMGEVAVSDLAANFVEGAHSALQLLGVGLFVALLLRDRRHAGGAVLFVVGAAVLIKGIAAAILLRTPAWEHWLTPAVSLGVAAGSLLLSGAIWLPRPAQLALAAIALLASLLITLFAPDLLFVRAPIALFNWTYGHLLNFNGLTHTVLLLWPGAASAFLFALAGRPGWGDEG
jgi:VanZ family protein